MILESITIVYNSVESGVGAKRVPRVFTGENTLSTLALPGTEESTYTHPSLGLAVSAEQTP